MYWIRKRSDTYMIYTLHIGKKTRGHYSETTLTKVVNAKPAGEVHDSFSIAVFIEKRAPLVESAGQ